MRADHLGTHPDIRTGLEREIGTETGTGLERDREASRLDPLREKEVGETGEGLRPERGTERGRGRGAEIETETGTGRERGAVAERGAVDYAVVTVTVMVTVIVMVVLAVTRRASAEVTTVRGLLAKRGAMATETGRGRKGAERDRFWKSSIFFWECCCEQREHS